MRQTIILLLSFLLWIEPFAVHALKKHQLMGQPNFAKADSIPGSPFSSESTLPTQKQLAISSLAAFPIFTLFLPAGYLWLGSVNVTNSVVTLINQSNNLNKLMKEFTTQKALLLLPYLGRDGIELLHSFLYAKQNLIDIDGKRKTILPFGSNGKRKRGVSALMMRDLLDDFIHQFHTSKNSHPSQVSSKEIEALSSPEGPTYKQNMNSFLGQLGYILWSDETIHTSKEIWPDLDHRERESKLYETLHRAGFIDGDGASLAKISTSNVLKALSKQHFSDPLQKLILHDLGLIHPEDIALLEQNVPALIKESALKDPFRERLEQQSTHVFGSIQKTLDRAPKSPNDFKDKLDLAILQALISSKEVHHYMNRHHVSYDKKNIADQLIIYKLALVESIQIKNYNYLSLDEDMQLLHAWIIKTFHSQNIKNDIYRIICMKNEEILIPHLTFITGVGLISLGAIRHLSMTVNILLQYKMNTLSAMVAQSQAAAASGQMANNASQISQLQSQIQTLTHIVQALNLAASSLLIAVGTINMALNSYFIITKLMELHRLSNSKKTRELLNTHLEETTENQWIHEEGAHKNDLIRFNALSDHYLKKLHRKSLINSLGLNFIWLAFATLQTLSGITAVLIILGVTAAISMGAIIGTGYGMFVAFAAIPIALLLFREIKLKERLAFATKTVQIFQLALAQKKPELEHKHELLLRIFLKNLKNSMDLATYGTEMKYYMDQLINQDTFIDIESELVHLYHCRKRVLQNWKKLRKDPEIQQLLDELIQDDLSRNQTPLKLSKRLSASTFRSEVDVLVDAFHPGMPINPTATFLSENALPPCNTQFEYERDTILSTLFNHTFQIYNNIRSDIIEYRYLLHKRNLQMHYFNTPLTKREQNRLLHRYTDRREGSSLAFGAHHLQDQIDDLETLHNPLPKGKIVGWDKEFLPQLSHLLEFNKEFKKHIKDLSNSEEDEPKLEIPDHSRIDLLIQYFIPLSLAK